MKPEPFKLILPFNLYPDGGPESKVVGLGIARYEKGGLAVFLIFENNRGLPVSVPLPEFEEQVALRGQSPTPKADGAHAAKRLHEEGVVSASNKPSVNFGRGQAPIVKLNWGKLMQFTEQEKTKYHP